MIKLREIFSAAKGQETVQMRLTIELDGHLDGVAAINVVLGDLLQFGLLNPLTDD